ncbi:uncharacterized protein LOC125861566 [Solanum stenotomum]|uniref:uncharacterized protein LOC125861566 n=1 Tax=Solanum stenotomum TaxID=172797 RepID=UPI0020D12300|nr:uncharacterized protein LOC125861566 [Solanum stenotomum]
MVANYRARMSKFVLDISKMVVKKCKTNMLIKEMDISRLMTHAQQIEEEIFKERARETKRTSKLRDCPSLARNGGYGRQAQPSASSSRPTQQAASSGSGVIQRQDKFYAIQTRQDHEGSPDVVIGMLCVFQFDVYALLDPGA